MGLEYSQVHKKAYIVVVCEFRGFENVLRDVDMGIMREWLACKNAPPERSRFRKHRGIETRLS